MEMVAPESYADSPFTDDIATVALPKGFSVPTMTLFDGTTDTRDHIVNSSEKMMVYRHGASKEAFLQQPENTQAPSDLYGIVREIGESIKDYVTRFNAEKVSIRGCDMSTAINAFRQGLDKESNLYKELTMYPCERFEEVQQRALCSVKDSEKKLKQIDDSPHPPKLSNTDSTGMEGWLKAPRSPGDRVRKGNLDHLLSRGGKQDRREAANQVLPSAPLICTKIINVITGGSELAGLTYSAAKRKATGSKGGHPETSCRVSQNNLPPVTFDETDMESCTEQHDDALTITLSIGNCTVRKVLVDTGSSVNLIMLETLKTMGFDKENLKKKFVPLVGYSGETAHSVGEITIPTYIEGVNKLVRYLVIEGPTTYNVILGRRGASDEGSAFNISSVSQVPNTMGHGYGKRRSRGIQKLLYPSPQGYNQAPLVAIIGPGHLDRIQGASLGGAGPDTPGRGTPG
ncbi:uncharacterized protein LOC141587556 [Silene latifolia]|uniref:uncharacterized protein LOC141587556 n=1 Tax=Silene latifolia TaxID=37657 RepID=UPI003D77E0C9